MLAYLLTYFLTPYSRVFLGKLTGPQPVKKFPAFYGTRRFITAFTNARHLSLSWASSIQSILPHPTYWRPILILPSHLRLVFQVVFFLIQAPNIPRTKSHTPFPSLGSYQSISPTPRLTLCFVTIRFYGEQLTAPRPNPQAGGPPFVGWPLLLLQYIHSYPPHWRPLLHSQPEDAPWHGDSDTPWHSEWHTMAQWQWHTHLGQSCVLHL